MAGISSSKCSCFRPLSSSISYSSSPFLLPQLSFPRRLSTFPKIYALTSNDIKLGLNIEVDGSPWKVIEFLHVKPGEGAEFVRTTLRNYVTGNQVEKTFRAGSKMEEANISKETKQYTYKDGAQYVFMDLNSFEEVRLNEADVGDKSKWLKEGMDCNVLFWNGKVIDFELPITVKVKVDPGLKGDTARVPVGEKRNLYGYTSTRKLQVQDFVESVITVPSSQKLEALERFKRNGELQTISEFNFLLMSLFSADEFELALKLNSSLSSFGLFPDNWTHSIVVNCYCKNNQSIEAKSVLYHMVENGFSPNVATFTTLINSFCESGRVKDASEVFDLMSKIGCDPTINTYNCLLKGLCYVGRVEEAYDLFSRINNSSLKPDIYTYTAMMDGFCKVGRTDEAIELLNEALKMELTPNVVTYNTLFNAFSKEGKPWRGFDLLRQMKERNCNPDYISYSTLLHGLLKWGMIKAALGIYKEMLGAGFRVDERMTNTLVRGLCRSSRKEKELLEDVYSVFEEMKKRNCTIYADACELLIEAYCNGREPEKVFGIVNEMVRIGYSPRTFTFNIAIHALCRCGEVDKALEVLTMMHKDRKPKGIPFNLLIEELDGQGRSLEACGVYGVALKRGVMPKRKPRYQIETRFCKC